MIDTVVCPNCGKEVEISEALSHEMMEKIKQTERMKYEAEMRIRSKKYIDELAQKEKDLRELKRKDEERSLEMEKKLSQVEDKMRLEAKKKAEEEQNLKVLELQKQLTDALKVNDELKHKLQQGSQQTQGEVLELELEQMLKREFPNDKISEVAKGMRGADVVQEVFEKTGKRTGVVLWESKNAKWSEGWIDKLREDMRRLNANEAVLVSVELPREIGTFGFYKGVWVTGRVSMVGLAWALRKNFWEVFKQNRQNEGKKEKAEEVYEYVNSLEFGHRVESIVEAFNNLNEDLEKEKRWFGLKWARQEKEIRKIMDSTAGMYGELQGVTGRALPEIKALESGE
ncbi:hypothetical protein A2634_04575 [Candidatus Amesbacteria bacterium RIFCSPHIGHO2_01_FULL_48_32]|uniref:DUF2130 domain-containing protein n=1 Tax=Candidatus Amesbacteria bacterium RIFCSPLOWO2_01_FULL_48_25 TaxID=1797259 RepID=A0A1F4ZEF9_9BACT|nr:MAG: hypothetical protein A2634_04575 [Candidatus Amesbacteria bacterium RIFCSPHIGHO2_01_FULL_48_32]OGD03814.1 MAG: hypothetical protein A2989_04045 [Candidatus Amesbacteria bacterium RIFCSPLOWO2_01_FULL_48_25]HJZ05076.1 DUF2130 domain-containing protein [Patescibacteria group bacterium]